ncbi:MAG: polyprenyl synthetase family protein [Parachlamydiaceae bacterium]|nr:polyprenyl synthetase family protein [Parachlamydiaceae bacterium]
MLSQQNTFSTILDPFKDLIEDRIHHYVNSLGEKTPLRDACEYALLNGGKRFRPALVFMVAKTLGFGSDVSEAALAVEFFHTASLIADDLPCMDNDDMRRNKPSTHKVYGESVALLATYALISAGYSLLAKNAETIRAAHLPFSNRSAELCVKALENVTYNTGIFGATGGQFLDILPPDLSLESLCDIIHKKTGTLFEISFVLGWIYGGGDLDKLDLVKKASSHFGLAFQIADDIGDMNQDKINGRLINIANLFGKEKAVQMFHEEIIKFKELLIFQSSELNGLANFLVSQISPK